MCQAPLPVCLIGLPFEAVLLLGLGQPPIPAAAVAWCLCRVLRVAQPDRPTAWGPSGGDPQCWDLALAVTFWDAAVAHTGLSPRAQRAAGSSSLVRT